MERLKQLQSEGWPYSCAVKLSEPPASYGPWSPEVQQCFRVTGVVEKAAGIENQFGPVVVTLQFALHLSSMRVCDSDSGDASRIVALLPCLADAYTMQGLGLLSQWRRWTELQELAGLFAKLYRASAEVPSLAELRTALAPDPFGNLILEALAK